MIIKIDEAIQLIQHQALDGNENLRNLNISLQSEKIGEFNRVSGIWKS